MRTLCLIALLATALGCSYSTGIRPGEDDMLRSRLMDVPGREIIWEWVRDEISRTDFTLDMERSSPYEGTIETEWLTLLSPQRFDGIRKKVIGKIVEEEDSPGRYRLLLTVWVEQNADIENPMEAIGGEWQEHPPDTSTAELLIYRVEQRYGG